ncbi:MAG TPA: AmmeMemoRadiSam system radical SAM enzyme [Deltaproteobacteria bacterium]|nr:AmmeMemoRadiSam system radical SAM enzyme [Deltaproteobacteria bacterium]HQB39033.1 AmmeMemoRadiSam system radical SAM enzyme [Deltaproteobacteria bacterium]
MREAMFYELEENNKVRCGLCRFGCVISNGHRGHCNVRENRDGKLYSLVYGKLIARHVDPIEKKPLFHVMPGSSTYSIATQGCNFRCHNCQNYTISQLGSHDIIQGSQHTPGQIVSGALESGCRSISYTYTEPTVFFEFALDTARLAREAGLANIFVTNGYISKNALETLSPYLDAANIDLKGFSEEFYRNIVEARLSEVLDSIIEYRRQGIWIEITTLLIPGLNDSDHDLEGIADFILHNLGANTPWHVTSFYPTFKLTDRPATPAETLRRAVEIGKAAGLHHIYEGNTPGTDGENTYCPACSCLLIRRRGFSVLENRLNLGACPDCGQSIAGVGLQL